jgi:16S rRNA processing protein RimM
MWVRVARVGKPSGLQGRVTLQLFTDAPEVRLRPGSLLAADDSGAEPLTVRWSGRSGARWLVAFAGAADRDAAERLRGRELYADVEVPPPGDGSQEWFDWQLVGLPCALPDGTPLGQVLRVEHPPAHDLLLIGEPGGPMVQVPFVAAIVRSVGEKGLVVDPPPGLLAAELRLPGEPT